MAKLKIFDNNNPAGNIPSQQGYMNVATGLIADIDNFQDASDKERTDLLKGYAGNQYKIYQLTRYPAPNDEEEIRQNNCKVNIVFDGRKKPGVKFGKHNVVLPEIDPSDPPLSTGYLAEYVKAIVALYGATGGGNQQQLTNACNFLFGVMLLTRCR